MALNDIALITTVGNISLYKKTVSFFPENIKLFVIDGKEGIFGLSSIKFMFKKLKKHKIKWLIMVDEDVVFVNPKAVFDIINKLEKESYDICGIRDGGVLPWRDKNPYLINPFFCILNLEKISSIYDEKEFLRHQFIKDIEFDDDLSKLKYNYDTISLFEDYYCFFLWLRRKNFKIKFLEARAGDFDNDIETTTVFNVKNGILLYHTWYARLYENNEYHTDRIDRVVEKGNFQKDFRFREIIYFKDYFFLFKKRSRKIINKIINKFK